MGNKIQELILRFKYYNEWRRQDCGPDDPDRLKMPCPMQMGEDIDFVIKILRIVVRIYRNTNNKKRDNT